MTEARGKEGLIVSALGAAGLGASVFLPWYHLTLTSAGVAAAQQGVNQAVQQFGSPLLQGLAGNLANSFNGLAGHSIGTVSAHQVLKVIGVLLLILSAIALVATLLRLADMAQAPAGLHIASVGVTAALFVIYRIAVPPQADGDYVSVSVSWGAWVALLSCAAIAVGSVWSTPARIGSWLGTSDAMP